ncbi:MAG TPA: GNAT family N-acetyltransferase [Pyrinomonadaceae bacterium]|jgi:GNAT superfamily N-acetyltransferase
MKYQVNGEIVEVITYKNEYRRDFERLNLEWIEKFFDLEDADKAVFADPSGKIIAPGGQIYFVLENGQVKGTCAVLKISDASYELAKMAVIPSAQGKGFGDLLMNAAIAFAKEKGASELILSTNTKLQSAIKLYEKHGFKTLPIISDNRYKRVDIMMRLPLPKK